MSKLIYMVGIGLGNPQTLTQEGWRIIQNSDCLIGAQRMLFDFADTGINCFVSCNSNEIAQYIQENDQYERIVVLFSGDVGFYSGAKKLMSLLNGYRIRLIPGISSLVYFCAQLQMPWEEVKVISLHGREQNIVGAISHYSHVFLLTGTNYTAQEVCKHLVECGLSHLKVAIGQRLSYEDELIVVGGAAELAQNSYHSLSVMIIFNDSPISKTVCTSGLADDWFIRGKVPMTKREVRCVSLAQLHLKEDHVVYDIGAGTGSVSIEIALRLSQGMVFAVEQNREAVAIIHKNKEKFGVLHVQVIQEKAPQGLEQLPKPDSVFIGGSGGNLMEILDVVLRKNPLVRIVINSITLETLTEALHCLKVLEVQNIEVTQLTAARSHQIASYHMMQGQNPVFIISGGGAHDTT